MWFRVSFAATLPTVCIATAASSLLPFLRSLCLRVYATKRNAVRKQTTQQSIYRLYCYRAALETNVGVKCRTCLSRLTGNSSKFWIILFIIHCLLNDLFIYTDQYMYIHTHTSPPNTYTHTHIYIYIYIYSLEQQNKWHGICQEGQKKMLKISTSLYPEGFWTQELSNTDLHIGNTFLASIVRLLLTRFNQSHIRRICHQKGTVPISSHTAVFELFCRSRLRHPLTQNAVPLL